MRSFFVCLTLCLPAAFACAARQVDPPGDLDAFTSPELAMLAALRLDYQERHIKVALVDTIVRALPMPGPFNAKFFTTGTRLSPASVGALSGRWRFIPSGDFDVDSGAVGDTARIVLGRVDNCSNGGEADCVQIMAWVGGRRFGANYLAWAYVRRINGRWTVAKITYHEE